jgi:hypothetical protein
MSEVRARSGWKGERIIVSVSIGKEEKDCANSIRRGRVD